MAAKLCPWHASTFQVQPIWGRRQTGQDSPDSQRGQNRQRAQSRPCTACEVSSWRWWFTIARTAAAGANGAIGGGGGGGGGVETQGRISLVEDWFRGCDACPHSACQQPPLSQMAIEK
ncbi:hypothetical protein J1614_000711 [Plenodomus biglobosus]|nr:hypothetical protein J1614_000711 [Plenodomus biglobosus]